MKNVISSLIISVAIVVSLVGSVYLWTNYKKTANTSISATGSAEVNFDADLVVWSGSFGARNETSQAAYESIKKDAAEVKKYLINNGIDEKEIVFSSVDINEINQNEYDEKGNFITSHLTGYSLYQKVIITSKNLKTVEKISTDISSLLESGVQFTSNSPEYYCTKLDEVKLELIKKATANAKERIDIMAAEAGASVGKLLNSRLGVFQITAQNTGTSNYTYDGYFDTTSQHKTATITVRLDYNLN